MRNNKETLGDGAFLTLLAAISHCYSVFRLGFYSDDWCSLGIFKQAPDQSLTGLLTLPGRSGMRPVQYLQTVLTYKWFGLDPTGYHLTQMALFILTAVFFYLSLRRFGFSRQLAGCVPAIYLTMATYSSDRVWPMPMAEVLSIALFLACCYTDWLSLDARGWRAWMWRLAGAFCLVLSLLAYEVVLPLFLFIPWLMPVAASRFDPTASLNRAGLYRRVGLLWLRNLLLIVPIVIFKLRITDRVVADHPTLTQAYLNLRQALIINPDPLDYGLNLKLALTTNYLDYLLGMPHVIFTVANQYLDRKSLLAILAGSIVAMAWFIRTGSSASAASQRAEGRKLFALGILIFLLGYAVFLTNRNVQFGLFSFSDRTAIAAALGLAISIAGMIQWTSAWLPRPSWRRYGWAALTTLFIAYGIMVNNAIASCWIEAGDRELKLLDQVRQDLPSIPQDSTILLDGWCPYVGPAVSFDCFWDFSGALQTMYPSTRLKADVVRPSIKLTDRAIRTRIYHIDQEYPYGPGLYAYNAEIRELRQLPDLAAAIAYFTAYPPIRPVNCPEGLAGFGLPFLAGRRR